MRYLIKTQRGTYLTDQIAIWGNGLLHLNEYGGNLPESPDASKAFDFKTLDSARDNCAAYNRARNKKGTLFSVEKMPEFEGEQR